MDFKPKDEKDLNSFDLLPDGSVYDFEVLEATDETSKSGNDMIKLKIGIYTSEKIGPRIFDYLLEAMEAKLRHFCDSVGLLSEYEQGSLDAYSCRGRSGKCKIGIQPAKDTYPAKNVIKDYICRPAKALSGSHSESNIPDATSDLEPF